MIQKFKKLYKENTYFKSVCFNLLILIIVVIFINLNFETNDDVAMKRYVSGAYGIFDYHLIYSNVILGYFLTILYRITTNISWYEVVQYLFIFISLTQITYIILKRNQNNVVFIILLTITSIELYARLQFTKTASIITFAGGLTVIDNIVREKKLFPIIGIILIFIGFLYRAQQAIAVLGIVGISYIPFINRENIKKIILICIVVFSLFGTGYLADKQAYKSDEWQYYFAWNRNRSELTDNGSLTFSEHEDELHKLGFWKNDLTVFYNCMFNDPYKFSLENITRLVEIQNSNRVDKFSKVKTVLTNFIFKDQPILTMSFAILVVILCFVNKLKGKGLISVLLMIFILLLEMIICCVMQNWLKYYVIFPLYIIVIVMIMYYSNCNMLHINRRFTLVLYILSLLLYFGSNSSLIKCNSLKESKENSSSNIFKDNKKYVYDLISIDRLSTQKLFVIQEVGWYKNKIFLGGWETNNPIILQLEKENGIENPFKDIIDNPDIILVSTYDTIDPFNIYLNENYSSSFENKNIYYEIIDKYSDYIILSQIKTDD